MATTALSNGPQYPAHLHAHSTAAERSGCRRGAARISGIRPPNGTGHPARLTLSIATFNARTVSRETDLANIIQEKSNIKCDILGLSETRRQKELHARWKDGSTVALGVGEKQRRVGGIGFIVSQEWSKYIDHLDVSNPRIGILTLTLPKQRTLHIVQAYAPTSAAEEEKIERFYEELEEAMNTRCTYLIVMGDFNAKVGCRKDNEAFVGPFGGERNERGEWLAAIAESRRLFVGNSFFKKRQGRRWTWISPNGETKNEIDYILCSHRRILQDVGVVGKAFTTGSDHRLVRAKIAIDAKVEKRALAIANKGQQKTILASGTFQKLVEEEDWSIKDDISDDYNSLVDRLRAMRQMAELPRANHHTKRISDATKTLLEKRRQMKQDSKDHVEYNLICKLIRSQLKADLEEYRRKRLLSTAEQKRSLKKCRRAMAQQRSLMVALKKENGLITRTRRGIEKECKEFYTNLFASKSAISSPDIRPSSPSGIPAVLTSEVRHAIGQAATDKAPGKDGIEVELLTAGGATLWAALAARFSKYMRELHVPRQWKESKTILLFKKGDKELLKNYRPICLLSALYKTFTKIILNRLTRELDEQQPREQAGFRAGYGTMDHIHVINQLLERCREYKTPLVLTFVDYEKAFDSIEINAVLQAIHCQGIEDDYVALIQELNSSCSTDITLFHRPLHIPVARGVKQGDTISPKVFNAGLEEIFRKLNWSSGININGELLNHLRFADDIVIVGETIEEVEEMLRELDRESARVGLRMNRSKTKWMKNHQVGEGNIKIGSEEIEEASSYVYLGQEITMEHAISRELSRRRKAAWTSYSTISEAATTTNNPRLQAHLFNTTILPALLYGSEIWSLTKADEQKLAVTERAMERRMLKVTRRDKITNERLDTTVQTLTLQSTVINGVLVYKDSPLVKAVKHGHVLVIDEGDKAPTHVTCVLKSLVESGEMHLADGRWIVPSNYGDLFACHAVDNMSTESELEMLRRYGPEVPEQTLKKLVAAFGELRSLADQGLLNYPYSTRELVNIVRHVQKFPTDSLTTVVTNVFDFDAFSSDATKTLETVLQKHGIPMGIQKASDQIRLAATFPMAPFKPIGEWGVRSEEEPKVVDTRAVRLTSVMKGPHRYNPARFDISRLDMRSETFSEQEASWQLPTHEANICCDAAYVQGRICVASVNPVVLYVLEKISESRAFVIDLTAMFPTTRGSFKPRVKLASLGERGVALHEEMTNSLMLFDLDGLMWSTVDVSGDGLLQSGVNKIAKIVSASANVNSSATHWRMATSHVTDEGTDVICLFKRNGNGIKIIDLVNDSLVSYQLPDDVKLLHCWMVGKEKLLLSTNNDYKLMTLGEKALLRSVDSMGEIPLISTCGSKLVMGEQGTQILPAIIGENVEAPGRLMAGGDYLSVMAVGFPETFSTSSLYAVLRPTDAPIETKRPYWASEASLKFVHPDSTVALINDPPQTIRALPAWKTPAKILTKDTNLTHIGGFLEVSDVLNMQTSYIPVPAAKFPSYNTGWLCLVMEAQFVVAPTANGVITVDSSGGVRVWETTSRQVSASLSAWKKMFGADDEQLRAEYDRSESDADLSKLDEPKVGKFDPTNAPHVGGNTWAGGTGGYNMADLGGVGRPFRLDADSDIYQMLESVKVQVPDHIRQRVRKLARCTYKKQLQDIDMNEYDEDVCEKFFDNVAKQSVLLKVIIESLQVGSCLSNVDYG
uniref:Reverse transcriptase domain-containing protein n=1 Tax=Plectus sambesii TaxID=2011161 RepID=A0A914VNL8_9BILA